MILKYFSRKFLLTLMVLLLASALPVVYKHFEVTEMVTMTVLGILGGVGAAYGFINVKDAKNELEAAATEAPKKDAA